MRTARASHQGGFTGTQRDWIAALRAAKALRPKARLLSIRTKDAPLQSDPRGALSSPLVCGCPKGSARRATSEFNRNEEPRLSL